MLSKRRQAALIALALFVGLGALAIHASPLSAASLEARLEQRAQQALYAIRADEWASVTLNGQVATVSGRAPSRTAREAALAAVKRASWAGGVVAGGVTQVIDETRLAYLGESVRLTADLSAGRLRIEGFAPDAEAVLRITARAERLFPGRAVTDLRIAPGAAPSGWDDAVRLMLTELARLDAGSGRIVDGRLAVVGLAANSQTADSVRRAFESAPSAFAAAALVRVDGGDYTTTIDDPRLCELLLEGAIGSGSVAFTPGRASLTPGSAQVLRRAGRAFAACSPEPLIVAVRAEGSQTEAEALALGRAEAIIAAMSEAGPAPERFLAESAPSDAEQAFVLSFVVPAPAAPAAEPSSEPASGAEPAADATIEG